MDDWQEKAETDGLYAIACAILALRNSIDRLGNADAETPMGALEALGGHIGEKMDKLTESIQDVASAIETAIQDEK